MSFQNRITRLFNIHYPIIQAGMVWTSGWKLASAVSNAGGLGIIGAGSMDCATLRLHIQKCKAATSKPFAVNLPLLYSGIGEQVKIIIEEKVPIVFTSAGNPSIWTPSLKEAGITVVHVVSSSRFAKKSEAAGCDGVVAEGFEAGGHNGKEETTTMVLIPAVTQSVSIPVLAAGGIATGKQMAAAFALGAEGVQVGSRFAASVESSAHLSFKNLVVASPEGDTALVMKQLTPVRLIKNEFYRLIEEAERKGASAESLKELLGHGRAKLGIFAGDLQNGELEIGQVATLIRSILPAAEIVDEIWKEFRLVCRQLGSF